MFNEKVNLNETNGEGGAKEDIREPKRGDGIGWGKKGKKIRVQRATDEIARKN